MLKRFLPIIPAMAALLLIAACGKEESSQKHLELAKKAVASKDDKAAVIELKNALQKNPENAEARALLGKTYVELADPASAEKELRRAMQLVSEKDKNELLPDLGKALMQQGQFQKVLDEVQVPTTATAPLRARILAIRGNAYIPLKQIDKAKTAFEEARKLAPDLAEVDKGLAVLSMLDQKDVEAAAHIDAAITKDPKQASTWLMKGHLLLSKNKVEEAIAAYQSALKADPRAIQAHSSLANIYLSQGKLDAASLEVEAIKKLEPQHPEGKYLSARIDYHQKKFTAARDKLQEVLKFSPNHLPSVTLFAATAIELGSFNQAEQHLLPAIQRAPQNVLVRRLLAVAQMKLGQYEKALETLKPLLAEAQPDPLHLSLAGEINLQLKQFAKATDYFERAAKANPQNANMRTALALSKFSAGQTEQAMADLNIASKLESDTGRADVMLILAHIKNKAWDQAFKAIDTLEKKQPTMPLSHNLRGAVHLHKGDFARARVSYEKALSLDPSFSPAAMNLAQIDIKEKKPEAARKRLDAILSKDKNHLQAMLAIAHLESEAKNEKGYLEWMNKAASANPGAIEPRVTLTRYYMQKKEMQKALLVAREAVSANPNQPEAHELLGVTQMAAGENENAVGTFTKLVALVPDNPAAYTHLGAAQEAAKNPSAARASYQKAYALKPDLIGAQVGLARLEFQAGHKAEALKLIQQIQQQQPKLPAGYILEGELLTADKQFDKAAEKYEQAFRLAKSADTVMRLHGVYTRAGKGREGEAKLLQWLKENPSDVVVRAYLAEAYMQQKQFKPAAEQYQALVDQSPQNLVALNNLAWVYQQMQDKRALTTAEQAHKQAPDNPAIADTLAWILLEQGQVARAMPLIQMAFTKQPDNQAIHYHYAVALARNNDRARAKSELERLLGRGTQFAEEKEARALLQQLKSGAR